MAATNVDALRVMLPRWRKLRATTDTHELDSFGKPDDVGALDLQELEDRRLEWLDNQSLSFAAEFASTAVVVRKPSEARDAADFILEHRDRATASAVAVAMRVLGSDEMVDSAVGLAIESDDDFMNRLEIGQLRTRLARNPRNAVAWTDLARAQAVAGNHSKAARAMRSALGLAPQNRFILRAGARLLVLTDRPDEAHTMLTRAEPIRDDPWVAAAEIAVAEAADRAPVSVKWARRLLESGRFSPRHLTELAGVLATLELKAGKAKNARRLFQQSLAEPNENALAQAEWASQQITGITLSTTELDEPSAFEARARYDATEGLWSAALEETWHWHADQSFAADASLFGSHAAAVGLADFEEAIRFAEAGLKSNPGDPKLLNNLAYSLLELDRVPEAIQALRGIHLEGTEELERLVFQATRGLLSYKLGDPERGHLLYQSVIASARQRGATEIAAMAALLMARQELTEGLDDAPSSLAAALALAKTSRDPGVQAWRARLQQAAGLDRSALS